MSVNDGFLLFSRNMFNPVLCVTLDGQIHTLGQWVFVVDVTRGGGGEGRGVAENTPTNSIWTVFFGFGKLIVGFIQSYVPIL